MSTRIRMEELIPLILASAVVVALGGCAGSRGDEHDEHDEHRESARDEHDEHEGEVHLAAEAIARAEIRLETARRESLFGGVEVPAEVQLDPDRTAHVSPIVEGQIAEVRSSLGDHVEAGDVLAILRSVALGETRAALAEARAALRVAEANHQRQEELSTAGVGARRNLVDAAGQLEQARARLSGLQSRARVYGAGGRGSETVLRAPIGGEILSRHATIGEVVDPGKTLFVIGDLSRVWVMGHVFAQDVAAARMDAPATLTLRSVPDHSWTGEIDYVAPALDEHTRTLALRMILPNDDRLLRPGLFGVLRLPGDATAEETVTVESGALQNLDGESVVFVPGDEEGSFRPTPVRVGRSAGGRAEVLAGLARDQPYVASGSFVLRSEMQRGRMGGHHH